MIVGGFKSAALETTLRLFGGVVSHFGGDCDGSYGGVFYDGLGMGVDVGAPSEPTDRSRAQPMKRIITRPACGAQRPATRK